ncbi:cysteine dioxygenase type 1-like isoform X2 [Mercenaria mercenaria]|uniref:cysteine dioxygenase type 1-like isoform X2 n=1 Tax=Mercenaria mercenaria TaxID=6596 RepID=UPI00234ED633|nr:cysteine dioxygenase type 1-like isoform X2 [Mercenaria mercenaria]
MEPVIVRHCCSDKSASSYNYSDMECITDKNCQCRDFEKMDTGYEHDPDGKNHTDLEALKPPKSLNDLIEGLHKIFAHDKVNVDFVKAFMGMYKSNYKEWKKFAKWDVHRYTRNLVDAGNGKFNLMVLCWNEAQGSSIHSHADAHCFMKVLDGQVQEQLYDWPSESEGEKQMNLKAVSKYEKNQVAYICDDLGLHRVENPSHSDKAVTLHLYSPPFDECASFDEKTGHKNMCKVTFWSKFGHRTPYGKTGADCDTTPENN